jgi:hypothetical protein
MDLASDMPGLRIMTEKAMAKMIADFEKICFNLMFPPFSFCG